MRAAREYGDLNLNIRSQYGDVNKHNLLPLPETRDCTKREQRGIVIRNYHCDRKIKKAFKYRLKKKIGMLIYLKIIASEMYD